MKNLNKIYFLSFVIYILLVLNFIGVWSGDIWSGDYALAMGTKPISPDYNLLLISIDTLRADHLSCYGYKSSQTPAIDLLASEGTLFTQAFTPVPLTLPSHCSIMTGLYPVQHGVKDNGNFFLDPTIVTLAKVLKGYGYQTGACVGAFVLDSIFGLDKGFDFYDDNFTPGKRRVNALFNERNAGQVTALAIRWLETHKQNKFFMWLHYYDPHSPYIPPFPYNLRYCDYPYDGEIAYVDFSLGKLFESMADFGLMDKTIIILTADHGEGLGEHNELTHGIFIYDSTLRVPLIIRAPALIDKGEIITAMVSTIDIFPTVTELLGFKMVRGLAGKSLLSLMKGKAGDVHPQLLCESYSPELNFGWSPLSGIRTPEWKFIHSPISELYKLDTDDTEEKNILEQGSAIQKRWVTDLRALKGKYASMTTEGKPSLMTPEIEQRLRSLGYISMLPKGETEKQKQKPDPKEKIYIMNYMDEGLSYLIIGLYDQAITTFEKVIGIDPENVTAHFNLACAYENSGNPYKAEALFKKVATLDPQHPDVYNHLGLIYYQRQEWDKAQQAFQLSLSLVEYSEIYYNLSLVFGKKGDRNVAITAIQKAIELDPGYSDALNHIGTLHLENNDLQSAFRSFTKVLEIDPSYADVHNNLGLIYLKWGKNQEALEQLQEAIHLDQNSAEAYNNLGSLYSAQGEYDKAESALNKALDIRHGYIKAMINLGMLSMNKNDYSGAESIFLQAIETDSNSSDALSQLGLVYIHNSEFDKAIAAFENVIRIKPDDPQAFYNLGKILYARGIYKDALNALQKALSIRPDLAGAHLNLGNVYFEIDDFQKAETEWNQAFTGRMVDIPSHLLNLGMIYIQTGNYERAIHAWKKATEFRPEDPDLRYNLTTAYFKQGEYANAEEEVRECLRLKPDFTPAQQLLERIRMTGK